MKSTSKLPLLFIALLFNLNLFFAQEKSLTKDYKEKVVQTLSQLINDHYVFPEVAKSTEDHLMAQLNKGYFDKFETDETFAAALTESVQEINHDKHMRIRSNKQYEAPVLSPERMIEEQLDWMDRSRRENAGFVTVKVLEGNVGYLDLRGFAGMEVGKPIADAYMKLMSKTDAIIIDLTKNGGGSPAMVQYLCSYFFNQKLHLNSLYWREGNRTDEFWTLDNVDGIKMPDVPLVVMTSNRTFSGAEEFSYNMQTQKRATLVGQTTGGGANPGGGFNINENLTVFIPTGKAINPITKTNWEGVGVIPEIITDVDSTFNKAYELAQKAADDYRNKRNETFRQMLLDLNAKLQNYDPGKSQEIILNSIKNCKEANLFDEMDINNLGYQYLMEYQKPKIAECILKTNTILYPNSANVFDSYAESLMINGDLEASIKNYQKAVDISTSNDDGNVEFYKKNLENVKQKLKDKE